MTYDQVKQDADIQALASQLPNGNADLVHAYMNSISNKVPNQKAYILSVLQSILDSYSKTTPKTKGGKIARFIARIASVLSKFVKI